MRKQKKVRKSRSATQSNKVAKARFYEEYAGDNAPKEQRYATETMTQIRMGLKDKPEFRQYFNQYFSGLMPENKMTDGNQKFDDDNLYYSNALEIEEVVRQLAAANRHWVGKVFDHFFIGKLRFFSAEAAAVREREGDGSYLVILNVGLSTACDFLCLAIFRFSELEDAGQKNEFIKYLIRIYSKWRSDGIIDLNATSDFVRKYDVKHSDFATMLSMASDVFIVCHEIAHHLLGDTSQTAIRFRQVNVAKKRLSKRLSRSEKFMPGISKRESLADIFGMHLFMGEVDTKKADVGLIAAAGAGAMITLCTIALLSSDPLADSSRTYPTSSERVHNAWAFAKASAIVRIFQRQEDACSKEVKGFLDVFGKFFICVENILMNEIKK